MSARVSSDRIRVARSGSTLPFTVPVVPWWLAVSAMSVVVLVAAVAAVVAVIA